MIQQKIRIVAVSGSLRSSSSNALLLNTIERLVPSTVEFFIYKGLGGLPQFDDADEVSIAVSVWRKHLQDADAVLVCSPEYAFGVPGSLKNAFDWTVGSGELVNKPLALVTASTGGEKAHAAWLQIFTALGVTIPEGCALLVCYIRSKLNTGGDITDPATLKAVKKLISNLVDFVQEQKSNP